MTSQSKHSRWLSETIAVITPGIIGALLFAICGPPLYKMFSQPTAPPVEAVLFSMRPWCEADFLYELKVEFTDSDKVFATLILVPSARYDGANWDDWSDCKTASIGFPGNIQTAVATGLEEIESVKRKAQIDLPVIRSSADQDATMGIIAQRQGF
jgi:hypothetical protein